MAAVPAAAAGVDGPVTTLFNTTSQPYGVYVDVTTGVILFTQRHSLHRIYASGTVALVAGAATSGNADGIGAAASFNQPWGIAPSTSNPNVVYLADGNNHCLRRVNRATRNVSTFAGLCGNSNFGSTNGIGTAARFYFPSGIALYHSTTTNADEFLYAADSNNNVVRRVVIATADVQTFAGAAGSQGAANGPRTTTARFYRPFDVTVDATGRWVYVADYHHCIRKIDAAGYDGMVTTLAGDCNTSSYGFVDGIGSAARFYNPRGIAINANGGVVYVADSSNCAIRRVATANGNVTTVAGSLGCGGLVDGPLGAARFGQLNGIRYYVREPAGSGEGSTIVEEGLAVTDFGNNAIRRVVLLTSSAATVSQSETCSGPSTMSASVSSHTVVASQSRTFETGPLTLTRSASANRPTATLTTTSERTDTPTNSSAKSASKSWVNGTHTRTHLNTQSPSPTRSLSLLTPSSIAASLSIASAGRTKSIGIVRTESISIMPALPATIATTTAGTQATSGMAVLASMGAGSDVSSAVSLAMMSLLSCSGLPPELASTAYVISVFFDLGFTATAWGNIGVGVAASLVHLLVQTLIAASRHCDLFDHQLAWLRFPALSMIACELLIPGAVFGAAASLVAGGTGGIAAGASAMILILGAMAGVLMFSLRHILPAMTFVAYASYPTGCMWAQTFLFPHYRWLPVALRMRFKPLVGHKPPDIF